MEGGGGGGGGAAGVAVGPRAMFWRHGGLQRGYPLTWPAAISPSKYSNMQMIAQLFSSRRRLAPGISGFSCPQPGILAQDARNDSGASPPGGEGGEKGGERGRRWPHWMKVEAGAVALMSERKNQDGQRWNPSEASAHHHPPQQHKSDHWNNYLGADSDATGRHMRCHSSLEKPNTGAETMATSSSSPSPTPRKNPNPQQQQQQQLDGIKNRRNELRKRQKKWNEMEWNGRAHVPTSTPMWKLDGKCKVAARKLSNGSQRGRKDERGGGGVEPRVAGGGRRWRHASRGAPGAQSAPAWPFRVFWLLTRRFKFQ